VVCIREIDATRREYIIILFAEGGKEKHSPELYEKIGEKYHHAIITQSRFERSPPAVHKSD
jgi:hypothetical protein